MQFLIRDELVVGGLVGMVQKLIVQELYFVSGQYAQIVDFQFDLGVIIEKGFLVKKIDPKFLLRI
jgi:hypothetical protein